MKFILVPGDGTVLTRADLLQEARAGTIIYEKWDEITGSQTVRLLAKAFQTSGHQKTSNEHIWIRSER